MSETKRQLTELLERVQRAITQLNLRADEARIIELEAQTLEPDFWQDASAAAATSQELASLKRAVGVWRDLERELIEGLELASDSEMSELAPSVERVAELTEQLTRLETQLKLSGPHDKAGAILEIHAGTGGTDAQDWAEMLQRMYLRFAEAAGYTAEIISASAGEEAGIKSVTMEVNGLYAYGRLKGESGVHRLVRLSPFNSDNLRQTSFALVEVLPQLERSTDLEIDPKDLRIDVYRAGGHGGQSVNTTDSAVRITHVPTGLVVAIQNERSQLQNREKAMAILKSRLVALLEAQHKAELSELRASDKAAEWGSQIRSYVLHPYTMVKDHRTGTETSQASKVLDGELDQFIEAYLDSQIGGA